MFTISQSCDQTFEVIATHNREWSLWSPQRRVTQEKNKAHAHATVEISESGMASIHLDVRSMMVKMQLQILLYCKGPTRSMWRWANHCWRMGMHCGSMRAWQILPCWQCRQDLAQLVTSLESPCQTNLEETRRWEVSLPGCEMCFCCPSKSPLSWFDDQRNNLNGRTLTFYFLNLNAVKVLSFWQNVQ
jgi:hypothetical protein